MALVRVFHTKEDEAQPLLKVLRAAGYKVDYEEKITSSTIRRFRETSPNAMVIALSRSPAHGREIAVMLRGTKSTRHIPIVFVDGEPEKVEKVREVIPDAEYTTLAKAAAAVKRAIAHPPSAPVVPPGMMERSAGRTTAQKMGIREGARVALIDPPPDYARVLGKLPKDVVLEEDADETLPITLWFVRDAGEYIAALPRRRALAARSRLWIVWPKGQREGIKGNLIREAALALGLVDYKICSVNEYWTAMVFAVKKA